MSGLLPLALLLALLTLWRARRMGVAPALIMAVSAMVIVATEVASVQLWLRFRETSALLSIYFLQYPSNCVTADEIYGHFSPPPQFFVGLRRIIAQVAPLEQAAAVDVAVKVGAVVAVIACALMWRRRRAPAPISA